MTELHEVRVEAVKAAIALLAALNGQSSDSVISSKMVVNEAMRYEAYFLTGKNA